MSRMIRKQIYIAPDQDLRLKKLARDLKTTEADIIRQGLDRIFIVGAHPVQNLDSWKQELAFIKKRARLKLPQRKREWRREDLHDRRSLC